jgi:hypothetical protein
MAVLSNEQNRLTGGPMPLHALPHWSSTIDKKNLYSQSALSILQ